MRDLQIYNEDNRYIFSNWTSEDFTCTWGGVGTTVKAGDTIELPEYKAVTFTKHLVNREMMRDGKDASMASPDARKEYESKTLVEITAGVDSPALASLKEKIREEVEIETGKKVKEVKEKKVKEDKKEFGGIE